MKKLITFFIFLTTALFGQSSDLSLSPDCEIYYSTVSDKNITFEKFLKLKLFENASEPLLIIAKDTLTFTFIESLGELKGYITVDISYNTVFYFSKVEVRSNSSKQITTLYNSEEIFKFLN